MILNSYMFLKCFDVSLDIKGFQTSPKSYKEMQKTWKADVSSVSPSSEQRLALEMAAFQIFHGGNLIFINSFANTKFSCSKKWGLLMIDTGST